MLVSQSVLSNVEESWWLYLFVCVCVCVRACTRVCVPGSCTGPQGQACVDWVSSTHSSLVESERNPHRWLSTFKKVGCVRHVNWGLSSFCSFLWHCSIQAIFVYSTPKNYKNTEAWWHLKMCFLMSAQTTEQEPALVIHHHKLLVLTWHVFSATDDGLVCSANTENGLRLNWKCGIEQSGKTPWKIN